MVIISIDYRSLKLADFMNFILTVLTNGKADEDVMRLCPVQVGALDQANVKMESIYERHRKNILTSELKEADQKRDTQYAYVRRLVDAERRSLDADRKKAGEELWLVIEDYGRMDNQSYTSQTTKLLSLCSDMVNNHAAAVEALGLGSSIALLNQLNNEFQQLFYDRFESVAEFKDGEMAEARKAAGDAYARLRLVVCGLYEWQYRAELTPFIQFVNKVIPRFKVLIGQNTPNTPSDDLDTPENPEDSEGDGDNNDNTPDNTTPGGGTLTPDENPPGQNPNPTPGEGNGENEDEYTPPDNDGGFGKAKP